jgi:hypothetical protein
MSKVHGSDSSAARLVEIRRCGAGELPYLQNDPINVACAKFWGFGEAEVSADGQA